MGFVQSGMKKSQKVSELQFIDGQPIQDLLTGRSLKPIEENEAAEIPTAPETIESNESTPDAQPETSEVVEEKIDPVQPTESTAIESEQNKDNDTPEKLSENVTPTPSTQPETNSTTEATPTFDPFNITADSPENPATEKPLSSDPPAPPPPPPPAPSFDPFASEPPASTNCTSG